jgi:hypothetical protein
MKLFLRKFSKKKKWNIKFHENRMKLFVGKFSKKMMKYQISWESDETLIFSTNFLKKKIWNIKLHENPFSGSRDVPCVRTHVPIDTTKLIVALRNFPTCLKIVQRMTVSKTYNPFKNHSITAYNWREQGSFMYKYKGSNSRAIAFKVPEFPLLLKVFYTGCFFTARLRAVMARHLCCIALMRSSVVQCSILLSLSLHPLFIVSTERLTP